MATIEQDLQAIRTAVYGEEVRGSIVDAIEQCYTDTVEGVNKAETAAQAADTATENANTATQSANAAATVASGVAANTVKNYSNADTYEVGEYVSHGNKMYKCTTAIETPEEWTAGHWTEIVIGQELKDIQDDVAELQDGVQTLNETTEDLEARKTDNNGNYPELTAGTAEQLVSTQYVEDTAIYKHRATGGSADVWNREYLEKIVGGTVCWNQLIENGDFSDDTTGWLAKGLTMSVANGVCTCTATSDVGHTSRLYKQLSATANHKYILCATIRSNTTASYQFYLGGTSFTNTTSLVPNEWVTVESLNNVDATTSYLYLYCARGGSLPEGNTVDFKNICVFDLTAMFGPTIADYIYGLEQATAGAGVAWFRRYFPNDYYAYNPGELISVSGLQSHDTVGFNAWDEEWELGSINSSTGNDTGSTSSIRSKNYIPVIPGVRYYIKTSGKTLGMCYYGANKEFLGYAAVSEGRRTFASNVRYIRFFVLNTTVYNHEICIHLEHSGTRNGEYEPCEKHSYPLDSTLTLRGKPKLDANGNLYFDGDEYTSDGVVAKKYGAVNLGTLTWTKSNWFQASATIPDAAASVNNDQRFFTNVDCTINSFNGSVSSTVPFLGVSDSGSIRISLGGLYNDMTVEQFVEAMSNKYLVYPLATPTTEQAEPYTEIQVCNDWGTEEFVSDSILPVGHLTRYPANLRDKLQHLPSLADADGDYIVRQSGSQMSLVGLGNTNEVTGIKDDISELRATASAQGIYVETESAPIVSISDGADDQPMKSVKVAIEPVQDLHGYDAPWPAGGSSQIWDEEWELGGYLTGNGNKSSRNDAIRCKNKIPIIPNTSYYFGCASHSTAGDGVLLFYDAQETFISYVTGALNSVTTSPENAYYMTFYIAPETTYNYDIAVNYPATDTAYHPYSNICPITGWTGVKVTRTGGKNLFDIGLLNLSPVTVVDGVATGTARNFMDAFSDGIPNLNIPKNTQLTLSIDAKTDANASSTANGLMFQLRYSDGTRTRKSFSNSATDYERITLTSDASKVVSEIAISYGTSGSNIWYVKNVQLEIGSTATDYEQYLGNTYEVTFPADPGTVYGGTLDVVSGKLVVDRISYTIDETKNIKLATNSSGFLFHFSSGLSLKNENSQISNQLSYAVSGSASSLYAGANKFVAYGNGTLYFKFSSDIDTVADVQAYLANNPLQMVLPLATPVIVDLTAQDLETLKGVNNVWSDTGDTAITYPADTKMYIDRKITEAVANALNA